MKTCLKLALSLMSAAALLAVVPSCEPENVPETDPTEKPYPTPEPNPEPDPDPNPTPDPAPEPEGTVIYYDNLDKEKSTANNNYFDTWTACRNMEGTGTADVTYDGFYTSVRSNWFSTGYPGASGLNGVYYSQNGSNIQVKNITLPSDVRTYRLSIGLNNPLTGNSVVSGQTFVIGIADGDSLYPEEYKVLPFNVRMYGKWAYATAVFEITSEATEHISIQIKSLVATTRSDDLKLMTTTETPEHSFSFSHAGDPVVTRDYVERPQTLNANSDWKYVSHRGKNVYDGSKVCAMPSARYLIALRTKKGNSGKPIWECSADEVMAIGFWFPQRFHEAKITELPPLADYTYSVSEIERMTGGDFSFFPLAPEGVKDSYSISDWPGLSAIAGTPTKTGGGLTTEDFTSAGPVSW